MPTPEEAAANVESLKQQLAEAEAAQAKAAEDAPPREPAVIVHDFMSKVAQRFGNHHELAALVTEHAKATSPKDSAAAK